MATQKIAYAAAASITCSIASKTSGQAERGATISNSTNLYVDALILVAVLVGTVTAPATFQIGIYASADDGTTYETGGSTDAAYTTRGDERWIRTVAAAASTTTYAGVGTVAQWFGGSMPRDWGIIILQTNCGTLSSTEGNHTKKFQGVTFSVA